MDYIYYMEQAYKLALKAYEIDEVPIGCVIVYNDEIIGSGYNKRNIQKNVLCHAEIIAIDKACNYLNDWRLENTTLFVTVEPCPMCAGAIVQARINTVVFGAYNYKAGCAGSTMNILNNPKLNHQVNVVENVLNDKCSQIMKDFFKKFR